MNLNEKLIEQIKNKIDIDGVKHILFIDGDDPRAQAVAKKINRMGLASVACLVDNSPLYDDDKDLEFLAIEEQKHLVEELVREYLKIRKDESPQQAREALKQKPIFGALLVRVGHFDGAIGGLDYPTADILRAGFRMIGPRKNIKTISSCMLMVRDEEMYVFSDISVLPQPREEQLADIAINAVSFAKSLNIRPKVAFLSFSTAGSAVTPQTQLVANAHKIFQEKTNGIYLSVGEVQFDAAFVQEIRASKYKDIGYQGAANVYIFPDLNSGNIGYKIAQRLGEFTAVGPIVTGISLPFNDLSRGATVEDVFATALLTIVSSYDD